MFANNDILRDAIDMHIHVGPDYTPRYGDAMKLAKEAKAVGMKAIIIKGHLMQSATAAHEADTQIEDIRVFGGAALNDCNGRFNPRNVEAIAKSGGKMFWLPTVDAQYAIDKAKESHWIGHYIDGSVFGHDRKGLCILDEKDNIKKDVLKIIDICKKYDAILGTGHISPKESLALAKACKARGFTKLEVTHANAWFEDFTIDVLKELVSLGAFISMAYGVCSMQNGGQHPKEIVDVIKVIGAENCILITDYGQVIHPSPSEGLRVYCSILMHFGITREEIDYMIRVNPAKLLGL